MFLIWERVVIVKDLKRQAWQKKNRSDRSSWPGCQNTAASGVSFQVLFFFILSFFFYVYVSGLAPTGSCDVCGGQRTTDRNQLSSSTLWVTMSKLGLSDWRQVPWALESSLLPCTPILTARPVIHCSHFLLWGHSYQTALDSGWGRGAFFGLSYCFCFVLLYWFWFGLSFCLSYFFAIVLIFDIVMLLLLPRT